MDTYSENLLLSSGSWKEEREYWSQKLGSSFEPSGFTPDLRGTKLSEPGIAVTKQLIPINLTERLYKVCRNSDVGLYTLLASSVIHLLYRYTEDSSIIVGMPSDNKDLENMNPNSMTALKVDIDEQQPFKQYLSRAAKIVQEARKHQHMPFNAIMRMLQQEEKLNTLPESFRTIISLNTIHNISPKKICSGILFCFDKSNELELNLYYDQTKYSRRFTENVCQHFIHFLTNILHDSTKLLRDIPLLTEHEINRVHQEFNATKRVYSAKQTIHELIDATAIKNPDLLAVIFNNEELTYRQLKERSDILASYLRSIGIGKNKIAALLVKRSMDMIVAIVAILKAGGTYLPIDRYFPKERIEYMLSDSGAEVLITQSDLEFSHEFQGEIIYLEELGSFPKNNNMPKNVNHIDDAAYLLYTSGSTGLPKGVSVSHRSFVNFIIGMTDKIDFSQGKTIAAITTLSFDISLLEILLPLTKGMKIAIAGDEILGNSRLLSKWLSQNKINMLQGTPSRMQLLINDQDSFRNLEGITEVMIGGEHFPEELLTKLQNNLRNALLYNMYGPTETTVWSSIKDVTHVDQMTLGQPIANTNMYIVDKHLRLMPIGTPGELCITGDGVSIGYWKRDDLNADSFMPNPYAGGDRIYRTGDLARWLPNGEMDFLGRSDHQVKIRGYRIELGEVESAMLKYDSIITGVCTVIDDKQGNKTICAYFVANQPVLIDTLKIFMTRYLPDYMLPSFYIQLEEIKYMPNGKIDRSKLPDPYSIQGGINHHPPIGEKEEKVLEIWKSILEVDWVGVTDDFFSVGGHSLTALKLEVELEKVGFVFKSEDIYNYPTIRGFINNLSEIEKSHEYVSVHQNQQEDFDISGATTIDSVERLKPFNDIFYRECFYNSLFPIIQYYGKNILPVIINDKKVYKFNEEKQYFKVDYRMDQPLEDTLRDLGIRMNEKNVGNSVVMELKKSIIKGTPVIIRIDCYYASHRSDTYQKKHWPHSLLVFGFNEEKQMFSVIEHDRVENLNYKKRWVSYEDIRLSFLGYLENFNNNLSNYYEFSPFKNLELKTDSSEYFRVYVDSMLQNQNVVYDSLDSLSDFKEALIIASQKDEFLNDKDYKLIDALNQIVNAKIVEKYQYDLFLEHFEFGNLLDEILEIWKNIRALIAKAVFANRLKSGSKELLTDELTKVMELEILYCNTLFVRLTNTQVK